MRFREAKKLHNGDEVFIRDGRNRFHSASVVEITIDDIDDKQKNVFVRCDDGFLYHHTALK